MKQKNMMKLLLLLALVLVFSIPAMGVSAAVTGFRVDLDRTVTTTAKPVNMVVSLLDEQGKVDVFASGLMYDVEVISILGTQAVVGYNQFAANDSPEPWNIVQGIAAGHISYDDPGTDQIRVSVVDKSGGDKVLIGSQDFAVTVTAAGNMATNLQLAGLAPLNGDDELDAGAAFTMKVSADDSTQSGTVTATFSLGADCGVATATGEMSNGIAFIDVPAESLTKAGVYAIALSMPSGVAAGVATGSDGRLTVVALPASKVGIELNSPAYIGMAGDSPTPTTVAVKLLDAYGNPAVADKAVEVEIEATNHVVFGGDTSSCTVTVVHGDPSANSGELSATGDTIIPDTGIGTSTLTLTSEDLDVDETLGTASLTIYKKKLEAGVIAAASNEEGVLEFTAGITPDDPILALVDSDATPVEGQIHVDLYDGNGTADDTLIDSVDTVADEKGEAKLKFTKKLTGNGDEYFVVTVAGYEPATVLAVKIVIIPGEAAAVKLQKQESDDYNACTGAGNPTEDISSITTTISSGESGVASFAVNGAATPVAGQIRVDIEDAYGNVVADDVSWASNAADPDPCSGSPCAIVTSGTILTSESQTFTYSNAGTDTLTFTSAIPGVTPASLEVVVTPAAAAAALDSIELLPSSETMLANGEIPMVVKTLDADGGLIAASDLTLLIDQPSNVTVRKADRDTSIVSGDSLSTKKEGGEAGGEIVLSVVAGMVPGDVTLTVRNTDGSVQGSVTLHIVASESEVPAEAQVGNPAAPMAPQNFPATVDPTDAPVTVAAGSVALTPTMTVTDCNDVKSAIAYIWIPSANFGIAIPATVTCDAGVATFDLGTVDFTGFADVYDIYFGYIDGSNGIHYNAYELTVN